MDEASATAPHLESRGAPAPFRAFGYGKVILLGEHAVVYDQPALAAGLSLGVWAEATAGTGRLTAPAWNIDTRAGEPTVMGQALSAILRRLEVADVDVRVGGDLPARAGLGSSAAIATAVARAIALACGRDPAVALLAAADAEGVFHGTASGIDLAAASSGQIGRFQRGAGWRAVAVACPITLCVGLSGVQRATRDQVDQVRRLREETPQTDSVIAALGELARAGERALQRSDLDALGRLFDIAHGLLAALRVSSQELDTLVHQARAAGALGAKLTGAGGGGAVIALAPGREQAVLDRWGAAGYHGFVAEIGSRGQELEIDSTSSNIPTRATTQPSGVNPISIPRPADAQRSVAAQGESLPLAHPRESST
jgi:mevalonate kinase